MDNSSQKSISESLWRIYRRPDRPIPWVHGGNLPWDDPDFSQRMLREHLDESHGAASRQTTERLLLIDWLWSKLNLESGMRLLDITCGPGLYATEIAARGCLVTGIDFSPASIAYARQLAKQRGLEEYCTFIQNDIRQANFEPAEFDHALFLYGQLSVFPQAEAQMLLENTAQTLKPGGKLCVELLNPEQIDKDDSTWWFSDDKGLWGDYPFLHLGERYWNEEEALSIERFHTLHLETGEMDEVILCDQSYTPKAMAKMMKKASFAKVEIFPAWDGLPLGDAEQWLVYIAEK